MTIGRRVGPAFRVCRNSASACLAATAFWLSAGGSGAYAAQIEIVAVGESNTAGYGVGTEAAYPAVLQALLRKKGYDVSVVNAGISGDSSAMILRRLDSAVPAAASLVILQIGYYNDAIYGVSRAENAANIKAAVARLRARGEKVVFVDSSAFAAIPKSDYQYDGLHLAEQGHALFAAHLLPQVVKALGASSFKRLTQAQ